MSAVERGSARVVKMSSNEIGLASEVLFFRGLDRGSVKLSVYVRKSAKEFKRSAYERGSAREVKL